LIENVKTNKLDDFKLGEIPLLVLWNYWETRDAEFDGSSLG